MVKRSQKAAWVSHDGSDIAPTTPAQRWQRVQIREGQGRCRVDRPGQIDWRTVQFWRFV